MLIKANIFWWKFKRIFLCNNVKYFTATYDQSIKHKFQNVLVFCPPFALMTAAALTPQVCVKPDDSFDAAWFENDPKNILCFKWKQEDLSVQRVTR